MTTIKIKKDCVMYLYNGYLHRADGPAVEYHNGDQEWWYHEHRHREDGPAIYHKDGRKLYFIGGAELCESVSISPHRTRWFLHKKEHRTDGPATVYANGDKIWCQHGKQHREGGPAIEYTNGFTDYWFCGVRYTRDEYYKILKLDKF